MKPKISLIIIFGLVYFTSCDLFLNEQLQAEESESEFICEEAPNHFLVVENMPILQGGLAELQRNVIYPELAIRAGIEGRVTVQFVVNEVGNVICPRVIRGIGGGCDEAALFAVSNAKFTPGRQDGVAVKVRYSLPIVFRLQN